MGYELRRVNSIPVLALKGQNPRDFAAIRECAHQALAEEGGRLIVDLSELGFLTDELLGAIVGIRATAHKQGRTVVMAGPNRRVGQFLDLTRVGLVISIFRTSDDAVAYLEGRDHVTWVPGEEAYDAPRELWPWGCLVAVVVILAVAVLALTRVFGC